MRERIDHPVSRRNRAASENGNASPLNCLGAQVWDSGAAGDGVESAIRQGRPGRSLTSGVYSPEVLPTTFSQPQAPALWKSAVGSRVPAKR